MLVATESTADRPGVDQKINIVVVTPWFPTPEHPVEGIFVLKEVQAIRSLGHRVRVVYLDRDLSGTEPALSSESGIPVLHLPINVRNPISMLLGARQLQKAIDSADIVHSHAISALPMMALLKRKKPWVHMEHWSSLAAPETAEGWLRPFVNAFAQLERLPDYAVSPSSLLEHAQMEVRGYKPVGIVPCVVPLPPTLIPRPTPVEKLRLFSTGGLIERKDPLLAIQVLKLLKDRGIEASLRWIGKGPLLDDCIQLADDLGVDAEFLGVQPPEVVQEELSRCDYVLAPTRGDNFFVSAAEALVNGRPLCAGANGGHVEYCDPRYSELVSVQTPLAYTEALLRLVEKTEGISAEEISSSVAQKFSPETVGKICENIYRELLDLPL